jgi:hypothetical protein
VVSRRLVSVAAVAQPGMDPQIRREWLKRIERELPHYGKQVIAALNAAGRGWMMLTSEPDYLTGPYVNAVKSFSDAAQRAPADPRTYFNWAALLESRIADLAKTLKVVVTGLNGDAPPTSDWIEKTPRSIEDATTLVEIFGLLTQLEGVWVQMAAKATDSDQVAEAKLRQLHCVRRLAWACNPDDERQQRAIRERACGLADSLVKTKPENGAYHFALGQVLLEKGDCTAALQEFQTASAKNCTAPVLERLARELACKPEVTEIRPTESRRWFGARPLVSVKLKLPLSACKDVKLSLDDKPVPATIVGNEVFYMPESAAALDGEHTIRVTLTDAKGAEVSFPPVKFGVDKKPPTLRILPEAGTVSTKQEWTVTLADDSGVDLASICVTIKYSGASPTPIAREIVKDGRYKINVLDANPPIKSGMPVKETFKVSIGSDMSPGECTLTVTAQDLEGNQTSVPKTYKVK